MAKVKVNKEKEKELPPVTVTSKSDPKIKAYKDSLSLYNADKDYIKKASSSNKKMNDWNNQPAYSMIDMKIGDKIWEERERIETDLKKIYKSKKNIKPSEKGNIIEYNQKGQPYNVSFKMHKKPVQPVVYKEKDKDVVEQKPFYEKVNEIDSKIKSADVKVESQGGKRGEPVYHPNSDLIGFMFGNKFYKNKSQEGIKPATKAFLLDDSNVDNLLKLKLGDYYGGQIRDVNVDEKQGLLIK